MIRARHAISVKLAWIKISEYGFIFIFIGIDKMRVLVCKWNVVWCFWKGFCEFIRLIRALREFYLGKFENARFGEKTCKNIENSIVWVMKSLQMFK